MDINSEIESIIPALNYGQIVYRCLDFDCSRVLVDSTSQSLELDSCISIYPPLCTELGESLSSTLSTKQIDTTKTPKTDIICAEIIHI